MTGTCAGPDKRWGIQHSYLARRIGYIHKTLRVDRSADVFPYPESLRFRNAPRRATYLRAPA
jgi:hypothetical protein